MKQATLSMTGYFDKGKKTKREQFLAEMDRVVPWARLCGLIEPHYPKPSKGGACVKRRNQRNRHREAPGELFKVLGHALFHPLGVCVDRGRQHELA